MVGCGEADLSDPKVLEDTTADAVDLSKLQDRNGVKYLPNEDTPFTGRAESFYEGGGKRGQTLNLNIFLSFASVIRMSECHASSVLSILGRFIM